ncbi:hypothetical protein J2X36_002146 [Methylobacterium sp. BE186]|uniref:hypothetical protein n=1 Tax=Methylobacterium sp. BE186 TaxID=2817715 RepID=UPI0028542B59|nr:hypothetical protein [Methylobacterium sp. BE186]MDR7037399.1 hypothetical protein [Methylobacterium sp. BE186]
MVELLFERRIVDARFILTVGDTVPIVPDAWFLPLARCLAFYGADESLSAEYQTLAAVSEASQETFHQMVDASDSDVPVRALYF